MAVATIRTFPAVCSISAAKSRGGGPISSLPFSNSLTPNFASTSTLQPLLRISHGTSRSPKYAFRAPILSCLDGTHLEVHPGSEPSSMPIESHKEATIDLKLPRRSLSVQFTCNACGARTQKLINRLAYERGTVFVQCAGCFQHHKLVDNLGLVVEYDFREDVEMNSNPDQV